MAETISVKLMEGDLSERIKTGDITPGELIVLDEMVYNTFIPMDENGRQTNIIKETQLSFKIRNYSAGISAFFLNNLKSTASISFAIINKPIFDSSSNLVSYFNALQFSGSVFSYKIIVDNSQQSYDNKTGTFLGQRTLYVSLKIKEFKYLGAITSEIIKEEKHFSIDNSVIINS